MIDAGSKSETKSGTSLVAGAVGAPQFVKPYAKTNKNDVADAEAICRRWPARTCVACRSGRSIGRQCWHRENAAGRKLAAIPAIDPIAASALMASIGDAKCFENGRQIAAWLGPI